MKPAAILAAIGGLFSAQLASANCYTSGDSWPLQAEARGFVLDACTKPNGMFTGNFAPGQTKAMCPRSLSGMGLLFEVQNMNDHDGFDLADQDCVLRLYNEINGCGKGGESTVAGWRFRADPGNC